MNWVRGPIQSRWYTIFNYFGAMLALVFGYRRGRAMVDGILERARPEKSVGQRREAS
jgi:hypothetical protein